MRVTSYCLISIVAGIENRIVSLLGVVPSFAPKGSPDPAPKQPDMAIRREQGGKMFDLLSAV
jgi:hypothetical protein